MRRGPWLRHSVWCLLLSEVSCGLLPTVAPTLTPLVSAASFCCCCCCCWSTFSLVNIPAVHFLCVCCLLPATSFTLYQSRRFCVSRSLACFVLRCSPGPEKGLGPSRVPKIIDDRVNGSTSMFPIPSCLPP